MERIPELVRTGKFYRHMLEMFTSEEDPIESLVLYIMDHYDRNYLTPEGVMMLIGMHPGGRYFLSRIHLQSIN